MAVNFTQDPTKVTVSKDKYEIRDSSGKVIGTTPQISDEVKKALSEGKGLAYSSEKGLYVASATPAGIDFDSETGKINISAPKSVLESDWFKKAYTENETFKQVASLFKKNPNDKTGYSFYDADGKVTEKTVQQYLEEQAKAFNEYYKQYMDYLAPRKDELSKMTGGQKFTEEQAIISFGDTTREKNKFSTGVVVYLPQLALTVAPDLKDLGSWNEETQTVNAKDFYEWYKLGGDKDEKIDRITSLMTDQIMMRANNPEMTDYDKDEFVRLIAFNNTLNNDRPDTDIIQGGKYLLKSAVLSFKNNLAESSVNLMSFLQNYSAIIGEVTNINTASGKIMGVLTGGMSAGFGAASTATAALIQAGAVAGDNIGDIIAGADRNPAESGDVNGLIAFGDMVKGISEGRVRETLEVWAKQTNTPLNSEAVSELEKLYNEKMDSFEKLSGAAAAGKFIGNLAAEIVKQVTLTNVIGGAVGKVVGETLSGAVSKAYNLPGYASQISNYAVAMEALEGGIGSYLAMMDAAELASTFSQATATIYAVEAGVGGFGANILAQGIVDTVLNDEDTIEKMLSGNGYQDAFVALAKNSAYNLFGEMTGFGTKKAVTALKESSLGESLQVVSWRLTNKIAGKKHTILAEFADWMVEGNSRAARFFERRFRASDVTSRWYAGLHWQEAEAAYNVARAAEGLTGEEAFEATQKAVLERMQLEIEMGKVTRGIMRQWNEIVNNEALSKEYDDFQKAYAELVNEEGGAAIKVGQGTYVSQDVSDYIARLSKVDYLEMKGGPSLANLTQGETEYLSLLRSRIADFEDTHSVRTVETAKTVLSKYRDYEYAYMNFATLSFDEGGLGLYDPEKVAGWRETGFWGEDGRDYIPLVRIEGTENAVNTAKATLADWESGGNYQAKISIDEYSYKPGDADAHYLDPSLAMYTQQVTAAKVSLARDWGDTLMKNDAVAKEINTKGQYITTTDVKNAKLEVKRTVESVMKSFDANKDILNYELATAYYSGTEAAVARKTRKILRVLGLNRKGSFERMAYNLDISDMNNLRALGVNIPIANEFATDAEFKEFYNKLEKTGKLAVRKAIGTGELSAANFNKALGETDLQLQLQRTALASDSMINKTKVYKEYVQKAKERMLNTERILKLEQAYSEYEAASKQLGLRIKGEDDFTKEISTLMEDLFAQSEEDLSKNSFFLETIKKYTDAGVPEDVAKRYLVTSEYKKYLTSSRPKRVLNDMLTHNLDDVNVSGNLTSKAKKNYGKAIKDALTELTESEWTKAEKALKAAGGAELVDAEELYNYIYKQMSDFVDTTVKSPNVIQVLDANGKFHLYEVSPSTADLYKTRPNLSGYKQKGLVKFFNKTNRLARLGNVGFSIKSFTNQWLRDPLNAYIMGGMVRTLGQNANAVGELLGPSVVEAMQEAMGKAGWESFSEELTQTLGRAATQSELEEAAKTLAKESGYLKGLAEEALGGTETETAFYREKATGIKDAVWGRFEEEQGIMERTLRKLEEHSIGEFREIYLRKGVFAQAYNDAISLGHTRQEAEIIAEYTMQNATTNFSRAFAWGNNITQSVSFLGAAINGQASFWRLVEVDPVGVSMRFLTGLVIPTMALVTQSLENENDRKVYESVPEYEKDDNLVFIVDGQKLKIPIPQELSAFIAPFRQAVEKAYKSNRHTWGELIANDILATSAIDLTGFVDLDRNLLEGDATLMDRLSSEAQALVSQLSPTVIKTIYMAITGTDPYTGNPIDRSKVYVDQNGQLQLQDSKTSAFTTWLSARLKDMEIELSGSSVHALLQALMGNGFSNAIDIVSDVFSGSPSSIYETPIKDAVSAFVPSSSNDQAQYAWNEIVKELRNKKNNLMAPDGELTKVAESLNRLDTTAADYQTKRQNLLKEYYQLTQDYQQSVYTAVKNLQEKYGAEYDRTKFAATIDLLTFYTPLGDGLTEYEKNLNQQSYYAARNRALRSMEQLGFDSPNDLSIFGYLSTNQYGEAVAKTYDPVAIMNQGTEVWHVDDIDAANMLATLESQDLTRKEMFGDDYKKAKAAGKSAYKKYKSDWNTKVVKALAPYIQSRGIENVLHFYNTRDILDNYIFIDNQYKVEEYLTKIFKEAK